MRVWLERLAYAVGGLVVLVVVAIGCVYALSEHRFTKTYTVPEKTIAVANDSATLSHGEHLVRSVAGCMDCHGEGFKGNPMIDEPPMGRLVAFNLTKGEGGVGNQLTPALIERAVRHGVSPEGRALKIMPSMDYQYLSDSDLGAIIAYVQHLPPANNVLAPTKLMMLPRALLVFGQPFLPAEEIAKSPGKPMNVAPGATPQYGEYLGRVAGCIGCHGEGLSGGKIAGGDPSWGPAANLTKSGNLGKWSEAEFMQTLRTGKRPDGTMLKDPMPWKVVGTMSDDELHAIWLFLQSKPARDFGTH